MDCMCVERTERTERIGPGPAPLGTVLREDYDRIKHLLDERPPAWPEPEVEGLTLIEAVDALNDVITGIDAWKRSKLPQDAWDELDELLARWIEAGPVGDRLA